MKYTDLSGKTIGYLTVLERSGSDATGKNSKWLCKCKCGNTCVKSRSVLTRCETKGHITSCGCRQYESKNYTHRMSNTRLYHEWCLMRKRCSRSSKKDYKSYEGRGITVCEEWENDFLPFCNWALAHGYSDNLSIDRIDVHKGYSPDNCRWVSIENQQANKQNTIHISYNGKDWCLRTLCGYIGFPYKLAHQRYSTMRKRGEEITAERLFRPVDKSKIANRYKKD